MARTNYKSVIANAVKRLQDGELEARRDLGFEVFYRIVLRTPVDTGQARANWRIGLERNSTGLRPPDPSGQSAITEALATLARVGTANTRIFITNPLPYIRKLENGYSDQSPSGMVQITLSEFPSIAKKALFVRIGGKGGQLFNA